MELCLPQRYALGDWAPSLHWLAKINATRCGVDARRTIAPVDKGTRYSLPAFMRSPGMARAIEFEKAKKSPIDGASY